MKTIEIKQVQNGFVVVIIDDVEQREYVFAKQQQVFKFLKDEFKGD